MSSGVPQVTTCNVTVTSLLNLNNNPQFTVTAVQGDSQSTKPTDLRSAVSNPVSAIVP